MDLLNQLLQEPSGGTHGRRPHIVGALGREPVGVVVSGSPYMGPCLGFPKTEHE